MEISRVGDPPRRALVTGASRGIGRAVASRLAREGYATTISARSAESLHEVQESLTAEGCSVQTCTADMGKAADIERLAHFQHDLDAHLDVLVMAAGVGTAGHLADLPPARAMRQLDVNFMAPLRLVQLLLPLLRNAASRSATSSARIVAIASMTGVAAEAGLAAYGASKAALISLCESITVDEAGSGVIASAISPGFVDTDMSAWTHDRIPPNEMITADDVAEMVVALSRLSRHAAVPNVVMTRPGTSLWRA